MSPPAWAHSPEAAAQQSHAGCLRPKVTKRNICHQVTEMSCFNCSSASWMGGKKTNSPEREVSAWSALLWRPPSSHENPNNCPHFPSLLPVFCLFSSIAAFCAKEGVSSSVLGPGQPVQVPDPASPPQGAVIAVKPLRDTTARSKSQSLQSHVSPLVPAAPKRKTNECL